MIKQHLRDITRQVNKTRNTDTVSLDSCERIGDIDHNLFNVFLETLTQDDFVKYQTTNSLALMLALYHDIPINTIMVGPGSDFCIRTFFDLFTEDTTVCIPEYHFPMYDVYAKLNNQSVIKFALNYDVTRLQTCDVVVIANPPSPIGTSFSIEEIKHLANISNYLLIDEAYIDYSNLDSAMSLIDEYDNVVITRSFSKGMSAAGCRIGYAIGSKKIISLMKKFRSMYELSGVSIKFAEFLLNNQSIYKNYCNDVKDANSDVKHWLSCNSIEYIPSDGNWIHIQQTPELESIFDNVVVKKDLIYPDYPGVWMRITLYPGLLDDFLCNIKPSN